MSAKSDVEPFSVVRAGVLGDRDEPCRWLFEGLWARAGVGLIGGQPKCTKTWLGLDMALSVASGTACLGTFAVADPGGALIYLAEDSGSVIKTRLAGLCRHRDLDLPSLPIDVIVTSSLRLDLEKDQSRLTKTIHHLRPRLLLLDPFVRLHRIHENDSGEVSGVLAYLRDLQRSFDLAVIVVHHTRKNGSTAQAGQALRGSGDFYAWADSLLYLRRWGSRIVLTVEHRAAAAPPPHTLALVGDEARGDLRLSLLENGTGEQDEQHAAPDLDRAVLAALGEASGPISRPALRAALRVRNARLGEALARLSTAGLIDQQADSMIRLRTPIPVPIP